MSEVILAAVQSKTINIFAIKEGGGWPFSYNNTETSSAESHAAGSTAKKSHTAGPKLEWIVDITNGFFSTQILGRCAPYPYTVARYHPQGPMFEANGQRAFVVFFAPPVPRKNIKLLQRLRGNCLNGSEVMHQCDN